VVWRDQLVGISSGRAEVDRMEICEGDCRPAPPAREFRPQPYPGRSAAGRMLAVAAQLDFVASLLAV